MKFRTLFENNDDHEYWKSMPGNFLHYTMHNYLQSREFNHVGSHPTRTSHIHNYSIKTPIMWNNDHSAHGKATAMMKGLHQHGWEYSGGHFAGPDEEPAWDDEGEFHFEHPNGSTLSVNHHYDGDEDSITSTARLHVPRKPA